MESVVFQLPKAANLDKVKSYTVDLEPVAATSGKINTLFVLRVLKFV